MSKEIHREEIVYSHPVPFKGQKHRSSGNFSTRYIQDANGKKPKSLFWEILSDDQKEINKITFQVYEDVPGGIDKGKFKKKRIRNGQRTPFIDERKLYIYLPKGAKKPFKVRITGWDIEFKENSQTDLDTEPEENSQTDLDTEFEENSQ